MAGKLANIEVLTEKLLNTKIRCYRIRVLVFAVGKKVLVPKQLTRKHCNDMLVYIILHL
jgi:hypothetical protein